MDEQDHRIELKHHGKVVDFVAENFPNGAVYPQAIRAHGIEPHTDDAAYWTACARWALLKRFGLLNEDIECGTIAYTDVKSSTAKTDGARRLVLDDKQRAEINAQWQDSYRIAHKSTMSVVDDTPTSQHNDLLEFLQTGQSNGRTLEFASLQIAPGYALHCHAHPNLELAYCAAGMLHEVRVPALIVDKTSMARDETNHKLSAPTVSDHERWNNESLREGEWLVNPVGSVHKSFTCPNVGCLLILLFGSEEADIDEHNHATRLQKAMQVIDPSMVEE